jgi:flagellar motor switch protein FliN/FliY
MSDTDLPDDNAISDDDWAAAMQEQADAEGGLGDAEAAALMDTANAHFSADEFEPKYEAKPAGSQLFPDFGQAASKGGTINDYDMILDIPVQITVELGRTKIAIRNLLQLAHGSVVELDGLAGEPMDVLVNGTLIAQGEVVVVNDKFGIRLTDIITPAERMRKLRS